MLGVEEAEEWLVRLELMGRRDFDAALGVDFSSVFSSDFMNAISLDPTSTLEGGNPEKSLWDRLWVLACFGAAPIPRSSNFGVTPRYQAVGDVGDTSTSDELRR